MNPLLEMNMKDMLADLMNYTSEDEVSNYLRNIMEIPDEVVKSVEPYLARIAEWGGQYVSIDGEQRGKKPTHVFDGIDELKGNVSAAMRRLYELVGDRGYQLKVNDDLSMDVTYRDEAGRRKEATI